MSAALTRRGVLAGSAAAALGLAAGVGTALATPVLSANDARLVTLADAYEAVDVEVNATLSTAPHYDGLVDRYQPIEDEVAATAADGLAGILAKARLCQAASIRGCVTELPLSLADDVWRLFGGQHA